jgi:hypothetical protein
MDDQKAHMQQQSNLLKATIFGSLAFLSVSAIAQEAQPSKPETTNISLPTKLQYKSAISGYQVYADQEVLPWREANDRVGRIGGWRAYAKEIATSQSDSEATKSQDPHAARHGGEK